MHKLMFASAIAFGLMVSATIPSANAAPVAAPQQSFKSEGIVEKVGYGNYCRRWNWECRNRWGFGWRYRRCMAIHGC